MEEAEGKKRKYKLFRDDPSTGQKPCAFYGSDAGCKHGAACKFLHSDAPQNVEQPHILAASNSAIKTGATESRSQVSMAPKQRPCAYFNTPSGCKAGDACPFTHPLPAAENESNKEKVQPRKRAKSVAPHKEQPNQHTKQPAMQRDPTQRPEKQKLQRNGHPTAASASHPVKTKLRLETPVSAKLEWKHGENDDYHDEDAQPEYEADEKVDEESEDDYNAWSQQKDAKPASQAHASPDEDTEFLFGAVNVALNHGSLHPRPMAGYSNTTDLQSASPQARSRASEGTRQTRIAQQQTLEYWQSDEPLPVPSSTAPLLHSTSTRTQHSQGTPRAKLTPHRSAPAVLSPAPVPLALPSAPAAAKRNAHAVPSAPTPCQNWEVLVTQTMKHPRYTREYKFEVDHSWVTLRPYGPWAQDLPPVIAIDCEMCETTDPVSGVKDTNALLRVSLVSDVASQSPLFDSIVLPSLPITQFRTEIHGIGPKELASNQFTLRQAQAEVLRHCHQNTVIVGHSVCNDLRALRLEHYKVVDTSYVFQLHGMPSRSPSLREVAKSILNVTMPTVHDSVNDARLSLRAALRLFQKVPAVPPPSKVDEPAEVAIEETNQQQREPGRLLVHRIPPECTGDQIKAMFAGLTWVLPKEAHASLAFDMLRGPARTDNYRNLQKRVYIRSGGYVQVRMMKAGAQDTV